MLKGYRALCIGVSLMSVAIGVGIQALVGHVPSWLNEIPNEIERERQLAEWAAVTPLITVSIIMCYVLAVPYLVGAFVPRKFWGYVVGIVLIALSLSYCCALPFAIWVGILWLKPEVRTWFENRPPGSDRDSPEYTSPGGVS